MTLRVRIVRLAHAADLPLPAYESAGAAGLDLRAAIENELTLAPMARAAVPTGIAVALPDGYEAQIRARSGLARRAGLACVNAPGTVDSDYRGELHVILVNLGQDPVTLARGERIAQMVVAPVTRVTWQEVETLDGTARAEGGFGSTGR